MNIKEFERQSGLPRSTVRFYEQRGLLAPNGIGKANGYRSYTAKEVERARAIKLAQTLGFSLYEISVLIEAWDAGHLSTARRRSAIVDKIDEIKMKVASLKAMERYLAAICTWIDSGENGKKPVFAMRRRRKQTT
jgi:MerR family transcriptional regulator, copper efflux regulator